MARYGVDPCPSDPRKRNDVVDGATVVVTIITVAALAIGLWALESLISALVPTMEEVTESE